jgi:hypothetical protein
VIGEARHADRARADEGQRDPDVDLGRDVDGIAGPDGLAQRLDDEGAAIVQRTSR